MSLPSDRITAIHRAWNEVYALFKRLRCIAGLEWLEARVMALEERIAHWWHTRHRRALVSKPEAKEYVRKWNKHTDGY